MQKENEKKPFKTVIRNTTKSEILNYADKIKNDNEKEKRRDLQLCTVCMYEEKGAFQAITNKQCAKCGEEMVFPSTHTHILCITCAKGTNSCRHCEAEMD